ncbi:hypothetical protein M5K25_000280 [Dendrobium thyrsiflorum]|uniref:Uncharacterized protein n=1 Tax=Dendrobium thyrsiflorum TaxID=117978 RepID=A0ABD0W7B2_DENTH
MVEIGRIGIDMFVWSTGPWSAGDGGRKDNIVGKRGRKGHSRQATEVGKTVVGEGVRKDCSRQATEVGKIIVGGRWRSKRPLSGNGGRKNHSRRATEVR